jgi:ATP-dependent helicase HrpB
MATSALNALPIDDHLEKILDSINFKQLNSDPFILTASPGSGKTTRLPSALLQSVQKIQSFKKIIVLVPKRIAAVAAAQRICDENQWTLGTEVGFEVRFENKTQKSTQLIFMTTGHFLKKILNSSYLSEIGWIIFDEFHERLLENDFLLGFCREQKILNSNLQIIVMSATLDLEPLQMYLRTENVFEINQQSYPLAIKYSTKNQFLQCNDLFFDHLKTTLNEAVNSSRANILVFLPGLREINRAEQVLASRFANIRFVIFHGQLKLEEQKQIMSLLSESLKSGKRYVVLTTNICETSLTLPFTDAVIDCGLERVAKIEKKFGFSNLQTQRISLFSATQRAGRAARQGPGTCYRLWHRNDELSMRPAIAPEIYSRPLDQILLYSCGLLKSDPQFFEWLSPPSPVEVNATLRDLKKKKLINEKFELTSLGQRILNIPLDLESAFIFFQLAENNLSSLASELYSRLDELPRKRPSLSLGEDDIDFILNLPLSFTQRQKRTQLNESAKSIQVLNHLETTSNELKRVLIETYFRFFKNRIIANNQKHGRSYEGIGVELDAQSAAQSSQFYIALQGFDNDNSAIKINYALGFEKSVFFKHAIDDLTIDSKLEYDFEETVFFKKNSKNFGQITVSEEPRHRVSMSEIAVDWLNYLSTNFEEIMQGNSSYQMTLEKIKFLQKIQSSQSGLFEFSKISESDILDLKNAVRDYIKIYVTDFVNLKKFDLISAIPYLETSNENLQLALKTLLALPNDFELASGRICKIDYSDEKAPIISARVQDFYGQKIHPQIYKNRIALTCQLLAPNNRPTQITKDLIRFWNESYFEIRKELKGRYPKHDWPDDPSNFKKPLRATRP